MARDRGFAFGSFRVLLDRRALIGPDGPVALGARAFDLLAALLERPGELVAKDALMAAVWPDSFVEENNLTMQVSTLRRALGDGRDGRRYLVTEAGRGYRFVAPVEALGEAPPVASPRQAAGARGNLPQEATSFVGRAREVAEIRALLEASRLVTVTGPGGVGKTRISLRVAGGLGDALPDGVWLVELAALSDGELVAESAAALFGVAVQGPGSAIEALAAYLRDRRLLLVLDNCEHLVHEAAALASALLRQCPGVSLLASSREPLAIAGEAVYALPPLDLPASGRPVTAAEAMQFGAIRLFVERATSATGFRLTDQNAPAVAQICRRLDGIALAIELAVPRLKLLRPEELALRLDQRFRLLTGGDRTALPRQQTLRALIDWSFNLLSPDEQVMLRRLSVFAGSFTLESAAAVAGEAPLDPDGTLGLIAGLVDKSLVASLPEAGPQSRCRLLESTRAYALEKLEAAGDGGRRRRAFATQVDRLFAAAAESWQTEATADWLARYEPELDNLRAALGWAFGAEGDAELGLRLASHTGRYWLDLSLLREGRRWFEVAAAAVGPSTPPLTRGLILLNLAFSGYFGRRSYEPSAREAVALFRTLDRPMELARALRLLGGTLARPGETGPAEACLREAEAILRPLGRTKEFADLLGDLAAVRHFDGDAGAAIAIGRESLAISRLLGHRRGILTQTANLAEYEFAGGAVAPAIALAHEAIETSRRVGSQRHVASLLENLVGYLLAAGEIEQARAAGLEALRLQIALGTAIEASIEHLALIAALDGELRAAARLVGYGSAQIARQGGQRGTTEGATYARIEALLAGALTPGERAALEAEGGLWTESEAARAALAAVAQGGG